VVHLNQILANRNAATVAAVLSNDGLAQRVHNENLPEIMGLVFMQTRNPSTAPGRCLAYSIRASIGIYEKRCMQASVKKSVELTACRKRVLPEYEKKHHKLFSRLGRFADIANQFGKLILAANVLFGNQYVEMIEKTYVRFVEISRALGIAQQWIELSERIAPNEIEALLQRCTAHLGYL